MDESVFTQYAKHADVLRNWFVAYGIGGLVLFLSSKSSFEAIPKKCLSMIAFWFIVGVASQVLLAFINKIYNFILYHKATSSSVTSDLKKNILMFFTIDLPLDLITLGSFMWATYLLFQVLFTLAP